MKEMSSSPPSSMIRSTPVLHSMIVFISWMIAWPTSIPDGMVKKMKLSGSEFLHVSNQMTMIPWLSMHPILRILLYGISKTLLPVDGATTVIWVVEESFKIASLYTADGWWGMVTWYTCSVEGRKGGRERVKEKWEGGREEGNEREKDV